MKYLLENSILFVFVSLLLVLGCYMTLRLVGIEDGVTGEALTMLVGGVLALANARRVSSSEAE